MIPRTSPRHEGSHQFSELSRDSTERTEKKRRLWSEALGAFGAFCEGDQGWVLGPQARLRHRARRPKL